MDKEIFDLGSLSGKVLLFGGIYSNLQALEELIRIAKTEGIAAENCICTGDIIGYCAQPEESIQLFRDWGAHSILGNVEEQLSSGADDCGCDFKAGSRCDTLSKEWYPYAKSRLSGESIRWVKTLPNYVTFRYGDQNVLVVHGSYTHISDFIFASTPWEQKAPSFSERNTDVVVAGHCGIPFHTKHNHLLWLNPGVIGMPANEGSPRVWYMILGESSNLMFTHRNYQYDYHTANRLMLQEKLPAAYADTLLSGLWDNMDILPEPERKMRGIKLDLGTKAFSFE